MKILNTRKPEEPSEEDFELLRRLLQEALKDPAGVIIIKGTVEIDSDGHIILKKT
jgi:hypothetical protein